METDATASGTSFQRPRPLLLVVFGIVVVVALVMWLGGADRPGSPPSSSPRASQPPAGPGKIDAAALDVRLEELTGEPPGLAQTERNPFRFRPRAPAAVAESPIPGPVPGQVNTGPRGTPPPPPPPPITVKFIGTMDLPTGIRVALFVDCSERRNMTSRPVREGEIILGQYRLVKIGLQSVVVEHLDGKGRTTLAKTGQECVK